MSNIDPNNLVALADSLGQFIELCAGHRVKAEEAGFSSPIAEQMALDMHRGLVESVFSRGTK